MALSDKLEARLAARRTQRPNRRIDWDHATDRFFDGLFRNGYGQRSHISGFLGLMFLAFFFVLALAVFTSLGGTLPSFLFPAIIGLVLWVRQSKK